MKAKLICLVAWGEIGTCLYLFRFIFVSAGCVKYIWNWKDIVCGVTSLSCIRFGINSVLVVIGTATEKKALSAWEQSYVKPYPRLMACFWANLAGNGSWTHFCTVMGPVRSWFRTSRYGIGFHSDPFLGAFQTFLLYLRISCIIIQSTLAVVALHHGYVIRPF